MAKKCSYGIVSGISSPNLSVSSSWRRIQRMIICTNNNNNTLHLYTTMLYAVQLILTTPTVGKVGILLSYCHRKELRSGETSPRNENSRHWPVMSFSWCHPKKKGPGRNGEFGLIFIKYTCQCIAVFISFNIYNTLRK